MFPSVRVSVLAISISAWTTLSSQTPVAQFHYLHLNATDPTAAVAFEPSRSNAEPVARGIPFTPRPQVRPAFIERSDGMRVEVVEGRADMQGTPATSGTPPSETRPWFVGHWQLVAFDNFDEKGNPTRAAYDGGRIVYDSLGNMSAQLMRSARKPVGTPSTEPERGAAYQTYTAYYGTYELDESVGKITHFVQGALNPNWVSTSLVRWYTFSDDGNTLRLSLKSGERVTGMLTWERMK